MGFRLEKGSATHAVVTDKRGSHDIRMARRLDEEQAAVDTGILDISLSLRGKLFS